MFIKFHVYPGNKIFLEHSGFYHYYNFRTYETLLKFIEINKLPETSYQIICHLIDDYNPDVIRNIAFIPIYFKFPEDIIDTDGEPIKINFETGKCFLEFIKKT